MYRQRLAIFCLVLLICTGGVYAEDWSQWRGPNRDDISAEKGLLSSLPKEGPKLLWSFKKLGVGYGSPAVVADQLYIQGSDDPDKGKSEFAVCLSIRDGSEVWRTTMSENSPGDFNHGWGSGPRGTPTVIDGMVYVLGSRGDLACLDAKDGKKVWAVNLVKDFGGKIPVWGYSESVLIDGDYLLCTPGNKGGMIALDKKSGKKVWQCDEIGDDAGYSSIMVSNAAGVKHYVQQTMKGAVGISTTGKLLWRYNGPGYKVAVIPTPIIAGDEVFLTSGYGAGCSLLKISKDGEKLKAEKVYSNKAMINHHGGVVRLGDYIYGYCDKNGWVCLDYKKLTDDDEKAVWRDKSLDKGSITTADGKLFCYGEGKGVLVMAEATPNGWKELGRFEIPEKSKFPRRSGKVWTHPVIANGKLYLRDHEVLMQFDVKGLAVN